ncbi:MAG: UDP-N-acetylmuramoyl-tripeptide--D-alanyl-D-alanine ligase [Gammaproteobacteria bacterium]|nr:UDP-N-acetylmuramoyl-tripeptide--D-alanyl-D-alanine ligase [Gammaproteobacteria bacterium]MYF37647.1 UDP-N-acetylmuramoyl-tripeptide--D-alanyl-D-alanine ligase [Gammaproteobacteria bacterium]
MNARQPLWTWAELCQSLGLPEIDGPDVSGIHFDSRLIQPGDLFLPLPGDPGPRFQVGVRSERDGHDYISGAIENGAVGLLASKKVDTTVPNLRVSDSIDALWTLGRFRRRQLTDCLVVAITGSSGKTTLKAFLQSTTGGFSAQGSFNNYIGLPLSLAVTPKDTKIGIYEIGTNHPGEIGPLSELTQPNVVAVLNVLPVHIGHFRDLEALEEEKFSIGQGITDDGCVVLPYSLMNTKYVSRELRRVTFGLEPESDVAIKHVEEGRFEFIHGTERITVEVPGGGQHRAESVAACGAVLVALNQPLENLQKLAPTLPPGRGNYFEVNEVTIIDDSYNANPTSMIAALRELRKRRASGRKIALLGQMNELGSHAKELHERIAPEVRDIDILYCVGDLMRHLYENVDSSLEKHFFEQVSSELLNHLAGVLNRQDVVLVKGSNSFFWQANFVQNLRQELA